MNKNSQLFLDIPQVKIKVYSGAILVLRLSIASQMTENWLFRPALDDWLTNDGQILKIHHLIDPPFIQLLPTSKLTQTVTFFIPSELKPGQFLKSWLRFPAIAEESIPIEAEVLSSTPQQDRPQVVEASLAVTLPLTSQQNLLSNTLDTTTAASFSLISGLIDLDKIPSRWLAVELLVILCQAGSEYLQTAPGKELFNQLQSTRFFENGVKAFANAQVPNWIANSLNSADKALNNQSLLSIWEQWLFSLVLVDNENLDLVQTPNTTSLSPKSLKVLVSELKEAADLWFAGIVFGLALTSPEVATTLARVSSTAISHSHRNILRGNLDTDELLQAINNLSTILQSLDLLPARWLVIELLLLVCQKGHQYVQTQSGSQLLQHLTSTPFFHNGVIAFQSAQIPRWLDLSHQAAIAYHASVSSPLGQGGLVDVSQKWLSRLGLRDLNLSSPTAASAFISSVGTDAQAIFGHLVVGLALLSPKIAEFCRIQISTHLGVAIVVPCTTFPQSPENILPHKGSLLR